MAVTVYEGQGNDGNHSYVSFTTTGTSTPDRIGVLIPEINVNTESRVGINVASSGRVITNNNMGDNFTSGFVLTSPAAGYNSDQNLTENMARAWRFSGDGTNAAGTITVATTGLLKWLTSDMTPTLMNLKGNSVEVEDGDSELITVQCSHDVRLFTWTVSSADTSDVTVSGVTNKLSDVVQYTVNRVASGDVVVTLTGNRIDGGSAITRTITIT